MSDLFFKGSRSEVLLPVKAECLGPTGVTHVVNFKVKYRVPNTDEQKEFRQALEDKSMTGEEILCKLVIGWEDVKDKNDEPIEFTPENLEAAMKAPPYLDAMGEGALLLIYGKKVMDEVRRKNSSRRGATG